MNDIEKALIDKCKNGDVNSFEKLITSYQKNVFNLCYRYLENYDDASEIAQEVFIKVYKSIKNFKGDSLISTWIYKIASTTCIDELRKRKGKYTVTIDDNENEDKANIEIIDNTANPHQDLENKEIKSEIQRALGLLSNEYKMVVILRDIQGFSYEDIGKMLDIPLGTVKSRIKRARNTLKDYLLKNGNFFEKFSSNQVEEG